MAASVLGIPRLDIYTSLMPPSLTQATAAPPPAQAPRIDDLAIGVLCGLAVALIWAGWAVATRAAVTTSLSAADICFLRFAVSSLFLWPILLRKGTGVKAFGALPIVIMLAGAGAPFVVLSSVGLQFAPAAHVATLMICTMPIIVIVLARLLFRERLSSIQMIGIAIVVAGISCIGGYAVITNRESGEWRGDLLFLACAFLYATFTLAQRRSGIGSWHATALVNVGSCVIFTPIYIFFLSPNLLVAPMADVVFQAITQGFFVAILGLFFFCEAVRRLGAPRAAIFGALVPAFSAYLGTVFLNEPPLSTVTIGGMILVSCGVVLVMMSGKTPPPLLKA